MYRLSDLLPNISDLHGDISVNSIHFDSRKVKPNSVFFAVGGAKLDGRDFIKDAIENGAKVIIGEDLQNIIEKYQNRSEIIFIESKNVRHDLAMAAAEFYKEQPDNIVAITGTNGKTSTAYFFMQICDLCGHKSASLGTLGLIASDEIQSKIELMNSDNMTTFNPILLHRLLDDLQNIGVKYLAIEASSHGLAQHRMDGIKLKAAAFTNLSRDHLDYHKTLDEYFTAKLRLFRDFDLSNVLLNQDDDKYQEIFDICNQRNIKVTSYSMNSDNNSSIKISKISSHGRSQICEFEYEKNLYNFTTGIIGEFQICNILCAAGLAISCGINKKEIFACLDKLTSPPGRMQNIVIGLDLGVYVDYAHTPDSLRQSLLCLKSVTKGKLHVVFGCGGERDKGKRAEMGSLAVEIADNIFVTDDNPRNEDPTEIRKDVLKHCPLAFDIAGRENAIRMAIGKMKSGDNLLIAGKGHENYQIIKNKKHHYSDVEIATAVLKDKVN